MTSSKNRIIQLNSSIFSVLLAVCFVLKITTDAYSQNPPETEIFLVELDLPNRSVSVPTNITQHKGYDNQPSFTPDGKALLYTSMRENNQTDIYRYDLKTQQTTQLTSTAESEYSPIITPTGNYFSVIRVEKDQTQRLWKFPVSGPAEPELVLKNVKPVGYHCWLDQDWLALFILGKPNTLQLAQVSTGDTIRIEGNIGRSLQKVPGREAVSFVYKESPNNWQIRQLNWKGRQISPLVKTLEGSEDFVWTSDGTLLMCQGSALYVYKPNVTSSWMQLADFSSSGIKQLTRLAIDPKGKTLALVSQ